MAVADGLQASCLASSCLLSLSLVRPRRRLSSVPTAKCRGRRAQRQSRSAVAPLLKPTALLPGRALTVPSTAAPWIRRGQARPKTRGPVRRRLATIDCLARKPIKMVDPAHSPGRGGLLQLLGMSLSPCCRFHPAEVTMPHRSDFGIPCCLRPTEAGSALGSTLFEATTRSLLLRPGNS